MKWYQKLWFNVTNIFSDVYEKAKEIVIGAWIKSSPIITKELTKLAKEAVKNIAENRKDLVGKDDGRRHAAQDLFKSMLKNNAKLAGEEVKDSVMNAVLEMAVIELKF